MWPPDILYPGKDFLPTMATTASTLTLTVSFQEHSSSKAGHIRPVWSKASTPTVACPMATATSSPPTGIMSYLPLHPYYPALQHASAVLSLRRGNHQQLVPITSASTAAAGVEPTPLSTMLLPCGPWAWAPIIWASFLQWRTHRFWLDGFWGMWCYVISLLCWICVLLSLPEWTFVGLFIPWCIKVLNWMKVTIHFALVWNISGNHSKWNKRHTIL